VGDGAAESIPAGDHTVDAVWTVNTIHHWTDQDIAARELARVLRAGGRLLLVDEDFDDPSHPAFAHMQERRAHRSQHFADVDPVALAAKLMSAGFAEAKGSNGTMADRPVKMVDATR